MSFRKNQAGFSAGEIIVALLVVGLIAFVGYKVYSRQANQPTDTAQSTEANDVPSAPEVESTSDLDKASQTLDQVNLDDNSDSSQLDSELSNF